MDSKMFVEIKRNRNEILETTRLSQQNSKLHIYMYNVQVSSLYTYKCKWTVDVDYANMQSHGLICPLALQIVN